MNMWEYSQDRANSTCKYKKVRFVPGTLSRPAWPGTWVECEGLAGKGRWETDNERLGPY